MGALVAALMTLAATSARAAQVSKSGSQIHYAAAAGETNTLTVSTDAFNNIFTDSAGVTAGSGCVADPADPHVARCPKAGTTVIVMDLEDMDDEVTVTGVDFIGLLERGGQGADTLRGSDGSATSTLIGGDGTDSYAAPGPQFDAVSYSDKTTPLIASLNDETDDPDGENVPSTVDALAGGPEADTLTGSAGPEYLIGGGGADDLHGLGGFDILQGDAGDDALNGDAGTDTLQGGPGNDALNGGANLDTASYSDRQAGPVHVTLDDQANDGIGDETDNARADVERIVGTRGSDDLTGDDLDNRIVGGSGNDKLTGRGGADDMRADAGDDTVSARDGVADIVTCGTGSDTVRADVVDNVADDCETVDRSDTPPPGTPTTAAEDRPPTVAFASPGEGVLLRPAFGAPVEVTASDDHRVTRVDLLDDGRLVASDDTPPYRFTYVPRAADVGRNGLTATAVDSASQTATSTRAVRVDRFKARVRVRTRQRRDRRLPYRFRVAGTLVLPAGLDRREACAGGRVRISLRGKRRTVASRRVKLRRDCRFAAVATARGRGAEGGARLKLNTRFLGNALVKPRSARSIVVRAG
jgi:hypothetical protein